MRSSLKTLTFEGVLEHASARLRLWDEAKAVQAGLGVSLPSRRSFAFGFDRPLALASRAAGSRGLSRAAQLLAETAHALNPRSTSAQLALGKALVRAGRYDQALPYLQRAAEADGPHKRGSWELARSLLRLERSDAAPSVVADYRAGLLTALRTASASRDRRSRAEALLLLSRVSLECGDVDAALCAAESAVAVCGEEPRARQAKANALLVAGQFERAKREYDLLHERALQDSGVARLASIASALCESADIAATSGNRPLLVAVGGGIGDLLHTTPMIRNMARRTGSKVDVLVAGDHASAEFLFRDSRHVNQVWPISSEVLKQGYHRVFLTYSFGPRRLPFQAEQVLISRNWRPFQPGHLNETVFNLEAARALLGIPYDQEDVTRYFAGELAWKPPPKPLVGLHAGSKTGRWLSKRWPHFSELAARLNAQGVTVASFGTEDEYVEGSENRTGGSIEEMSRAMLECSVFVSNDSGPMHIASAMEIPVLALYAPTDPLTHLPLAPHVTALALEKSCAPCEVKNHSYFATGACRCVGEIALDTVEQKTLDLLRQSMERARALVESGA